MRFVPKNPEGFCFLMVLLRQSAGYVARHACAARVRCGDRLPPLTGSGAYSHDAIIGNSAAAPNLFERAVRLWAATHRSATQRERSAATSASASAGIVLL